MLAQATVCLGTAKASEMVYIRAPSIMDASARAKAVKETKELLKKAEIYMSIAASLRKLLDKC